MFLSRSIRLAKPSTLNLTKFTLPHNINVAARSFSNQRTSHTSMVSREPFTVVNKLARFLSSQPSGWQNFPDDKDSKSKAAEPDNTEKKDKQSTQQQSESKSEQKSEKPKQSRQQQTRKDEDDDEDEEPSGFRPNWKMIGLIAAGVVGWMALSADSVPLGLPIEWDELVPFISKRLVKKIEVREAGIAVITVEDPNATGHTQVYRMSIGNPEVFQKKVENLQRSLGVEHESFIAIVQKPVDPVFQEFLKLIPSIAIFGLTIYAITALSRRGLGLGGGGGANNPFNSFKSRAKLFNKEDKVKVTFADVAGLPEAKQEIQEFVDFLKSPKKYADLGAKVPKGALLVGPPGTGKTLLAKASAGEASVPFWSTSGSDFVEMFAGVGPARVRDLFTKARASAPCIIFIDEIDAIGRARSGKSMTGGNDERENTLNQLLVEMDGFAQNTGIIILAGTNRPDVLDSALKRPGRFDRTIELDKPDIKSRAEIFLIHLRPLKLKATVEERANVIKQLADRMAQLTPGFSGADIANTCNEAALIAARKGADAVELVHLEAAIDRIIGGLEKKDKVLSPEEKKIIAHHEAGHAVLGWFLEHTDPLLKVSIIPRGTAALGFAQYQPREQFLYTQQQLLDRMTMALGGRVAEEIFFNEITTGAQDDLDRVTRMAYSQVLLYGWSDRVGSLSFKQEENQIKPYSQETQRVIDEEVRTLVDAAYQRARTVLKSRTSDLKAVADLLLQREVIHHDDMLKLLGPRPATPPIRPLFELEAANTPNDTSSTSQQNNQSGQQPQTV